MDMSTFGLNPAGLPGFPGGKRRKVDRIATPSYAVYTPKAAAEPRTEAGDEACYDDDMAAKLDEIAVDLTPEQQAVYTAVVHEGRSVFFTGNAGCGKSHLLQKVVRGLRYKHVVHHQAVFVTASTGIAAVALGGMTLNAFAGVGCGANSVEQILLAMKSKQTARWTNCKVLVIDEVSMVDGQLLDKIDQLGRAIRNNQTPMGGIQIVCSGDFCQLPPVVTDKARGISFAFDSRVWATLFRDRASQFELRKPFRCNDQRFLKLLGEVRSGDPRRLSQQSRRLLDEMARPLPAGAVKPTVLFAKNADVDRFNQDQLKKIGRDQFSFTACSSGSLSEPFAKSFGAPVLWLAVGAQVMLTKNEDLWAGLANGARGVVTGFEARRDLRLKSTVLPIIQFILSDGTEVEKAITPVTFDKKDGDRVVASRYQLPLKLAWAMTIHKSQGLTLPQLEVSLTSCFEYGQAYVALSRGTGVDGVRVTDWAEKPLMKQHARVMQYFATPHHGGLATQPTTPTTTASPSSSAATARPTPAKVAVTASRWQKPSASKAFAPAKLANQSKAAYAVFKGRGAPTALGSRGIPKGIAACLADTKFVITGVFESLERNQIEAVITKYGGKVQSTVNSKTDYCLVGRDPGPMKLDLAAKHGPAVLNEDGFFKHIETAGPVTLLHSKEGGVFWTITQAGRKTTVVWGLQATMGEARTAEKRFTTTAAATAYAADKVGSKLGKGFVCDCPERLAAFKDAESSTKLPATSRANRAQ